MGASKIINFQTNPNFGNLEFPNLEKNLESFFQKIQNLKDLEFLIKALNPLIKENRFNDLEKQKLKRLRQRAYDKRRNSKFLENQTLPNLESELPKTPNLPSKKAENQKVETSKIKIVKEKSMNQISNQTPTNTINEINFSDGIMKAIKQIDSEKLAKKTPAFLAWFLASSLAAFFIWQQSVQLYSTAGFQNSLLAALGGLLMVIGFTAYYSISRSFIALFLCLYAVGYEGYLMISGTVNNESQTLEHSIAASPEYIFLKDKAEKERENYQRQKTRYENPESKVFHNEWFKKEFLDPAWNARASANRELIKFKAASMTANGNQHILWLKIFYRLGLVFLCMLFIHRLFSLKLHSPRHELR